MGVWITIWLAIALVSTRNPISHGQVLEAFTTLMDIYYVGQQLADQYGDDSSPNDVYQEIDDVKEEVKTDMKKILKEIAKLPSMQNLQKEREALQTHADKIADIFEESVKIQRNINHGKFNYFSEDEEYVTLNNKELKNHWDDMRHTLLHTNVITNFTSDFYTELKEFENVCVTNMSALQLLNTLLLHFITSAGQYFYSRHIMFNFFEKYHQDKHKYDSQRDEFNEEFKEKYGEILNSFKQKMARASPKFWRCDPEKFNSSTYYELETFTQYFSREEDFPVDFKKCAGNCANEHELEIFHTEDKSDLPGADACVKSKCGNPKVTKCSSTWCNTRLCPNNLTDCKPIPLNYQYSLCITGDPKAEQRYTVVDRPGSPFDCTWKKSYYEYSMTDTLGTYTPVNFWAYSCICPEKDYYISYHTAVADDGYIVVGAKLQVYNDWLLYVKIKQAKPLPGGKINATSLQWQEHPKRAPKLPLEEVAAFYRQKISWDNCNEIDLTDNVVPKGHVITGLGFSECINGRFHLEVFTKKFDLKSAKFFDRGHRKEDHIEGTNIYDLYDNSDVPTRATNKNAPDSPDDAYVKFSLTSLEKDGGQSVVPFVDTQDVTPHPLTALSGASLIVRGQDGYGGFLALEFRTYDLVPEIPDAVVADKNNVKKVLDRM